MKVTCDYLIICETIIQDMSGKKSLINMFNNIISTGTQIVLNNISFFAKLKGEQGKYDFRLDMKYTDEKKPFIGLGGAVEISKEKDMDLSILMGSVKFPKYGDCIIVLSIDNEVIATRTIGVKKMLPGGK